MALRVAATARARAPRQTHALLPDARSSLTLARAISAVRGGETAGRVRRPGDAEWPSVRRQLRETPRLRGAAPGGARVRRADTLFVVEALGTGRAQGARESARSTELGRTRLAMAARVAAAQRAIREIADAGRGVGRRVAAGRRRLRTVRFERRTPAGLDARVEREPRFRVEAQGRIDGRARTCVEGRVGASSRLRVGGDVGTPVVHAGRTRVGARLGAAVTRVRRTAGGRLTAASDAGKGKDEGECHAKAKGSNGEPPKTTRPGPVHEIHRGPR
jgi:hypothetical protein